MKRSVIALLSVFLCSCTVSRETADQAPTISDTPPVLETRTINLLNAENKEMVLTAEIADEPAEQSQGLMGRTNLPENHGMLFIFDAERPLTFWMQGTVIPLDIVYFAADGSFVSSTTMPPCENDPCPLYPSGGPARYALEMAEGFTEIYGVGSGWHLVLP